uniref:DUF659 domain-containing protein n=1 Tax=Cacopsylla melanoneura TaxID=428564 RepID=A0A8D8R275_9HEMI
MIHATCLAHGLHRVAEAVCEEHPLVNKPISVGKKIFLKAPNRVEVFRKNLPGVPLPPEPVITRWGTWLSAVGYYVKHFAGFKQVVLELEEDAVSVKTAKEILADPKLLPQLVFIDQNFKDIPETIDALQSQKILFVSGVEKMKKISEKKYPGPIGNKINQKVEAVLRRNCGWEEMKNIAKVQEGNEGQLKEGWCINDVIVMKFAPVTSADVERSFSKMKYVLSDRRQSFTMENFAYHVMLFYNNVQ